ncbi:TetR/AcrR family transcriptional regulator [soil metagenome]
MAAKQASPDRVQLRVTGDPPPERADAARNRHALLDAARRIIGSCGVDALSMDRVGAEASVGVGTVYRRFGDRAGLLYALLDEGERRLQEGFLSGPPPLGPGAPPAQRIRAMLHALVDLLESEGDLQAYADAQSPTSRFRSGAHWARRAHLRSLLDLARPGIDAVYVADALLAAVSAALVLHQRRELGFSTERIKAGVDSLLEGVL